MSVQKEPGSAELEMPVGKELGDLALTNMPEPDMPEPINEAGKPIEKEPTVFRNHFVGYMDLYSDRRTVMAYLDAHQGWFRRCAKPFKADALGTTGYAMGVGKVGAFGFFVEPKVGLNLLPQDQGVYRILTVPIPDQPPLGYEVDFQAKMELVEKSTAPEFQSLSPVITVVQWTLDLTVTLQFPKFILSMSRDWIQNTGDGVLAMVVKRVSNSLTAKVQTDFHQTHEIKIPKHLKHKKQ